MKISEQWLREWVNPPLSTGELAAQLTMAGLEVEALEPVAASFAGVVVGEVVDCVAHPSADQLTVCQVNVGAVQPLTVVCGAPNVRVGLRAPLAMVGAQLPNDLTIRAATLRGVESHGMLCSAAELGLGDGNGGLLELPTDTRIGEDVYAYLHLDDHAIELSITPNRGDCLSILGVAREIAALSGCALTAPPPDAVAPGGNASLPVSVEAAQDCPRYVGRVITGIRQDARTPLWMHERLRRSGVRSIHPVVDVTNYVMLELGQPMHAFDLATLHGGIRVRHALPGETLALLDGQTVTLDTHTLVIADQRQAHALAGIMGGAASAVGAATASLFLESAFFAPRPLAGRARRYGLHTDSSFRFERGVDPQLPRRALERATALLLEIVGGQAGPVVEVDAPRQLPTRAPILLRAARVRRVLGLELSAAQVSDILTRLGMAPAAHGQDWQVTPPSYRFDIALEADLIEELARVYGYERLPVSKPSARLHIRPRPEAHISISRVRHVLIDNGYQEVITYSFVDPALQQRLDPQRTPVALQNPIASDMAVLRTTLWCGLIQTLLHNQNRRQTRQKLFESGLNFIVQDTELSQENYIAGAATGSAHPEQWGLPARPVDFYDIKSDIEALLALSGAPDTFSFDAHGHPALHPGQSARITRHGKAIGWVGALHPQIQRELGLNERVYLFEIQLAALQQGQVPQFRELSKFPAIQRDIAVIVDQSVPAEALCKAVAQVAPELIRELRLFDTYQGKGIDLGKKSLALGLTLQAPSRTLTDHEADALIERVVQRLYNEFSATLRK